MTLREYRETLNNFIKENPKALDMEVIYSQDDEGNAFYPVIYTPCLKRYNGYGEIADDENPNTVCIN